MVVILPFASSFANGSLNTYKPVTKKYTMQRRYSRRVTITLNNGSLRDNLERIAKTHGWPKVAWNLPDDYRWVGHTRITANSLPSAFGKILNNYPVQAQFWRGNRVLAIVPRNLG